MRFFFFFLFYSSFVLSQNNIDEELAKNFFDSREFEKAEVYLKKLFEANPKKFYTLYNKTLCSLKKYEESIKISQFLWKETKSNLEYKFNIGLAFLKKGDTNQAYKEWKQANKIAENDLDETNSLLKLYKDNKTWKFIEELVISHREKIKDLFIHNDLLIEAYLAQDKNQAAIETIVLAVEKDDYNYMNTLMRIQSFAHNSELIRLSEKKIYGKLAQFPNSEKWNQAAMWLSILTKDYDASLSISIAYDKRNGSSGSYVLNIADIALNEEEYETALKGYNYIGQSSTIQSMRKLGFEKIIQAYFLKIESYSGTDSIDIDSLDNVLSNYFKIFGEDANTAEMQLIKANLMVRYQSKLNQAILLLEKISELPNLQKNTQSKLLLKLADYMVMNNDIWEASLIYGKVDKEEKDSPLGEEARYKNSKIFYYNGDFELAGELLSILKSSTTELLANDALYLSVFIQENMDNDTFQKAMKAIAQSELLFYQNKTKEAIAILQNIKNKYPMSNLIDDILILEAMEGIRTKNYESSSQLLKIIIEKHGASILADKALYEWSKIQEMIFKNNEEAKDGYLKLLTIYKDSVYSADTRKRLRKLRGDKLEEEL